MSYLGLVSDFKRLGLGDMGLGSRLGLGLEGLVHIPGRNCCFNNFSNTYAFSLTCSTPENMAS